MGDLSSSVYSKRRGPLPRLTIVSHVPVLPVKSVMRPPNSADCLMTHGPPVSPSLFSVVFQVARTSDLRAESTATPRIGLRRVSVFAGAVGLLCAAGCGA